MTGFVRGVGSSKPVIRQVGPIMSMYGAMEDGPISMGGVDADDDISPSDSWTVISSYFEMHGLVRQQLDSFNESDRRIS